METNNKLKMSNKKLLNISSEILEILEEVSELEGELTPELEAKLAISEAQLETKANQYNWVIVKLDSNNDAIDREIERLKSLKAKNDKVTEILKNKLLDTVLLLGVDRKGVYEIKLPTITLKTRKSNSIEITGAIDDKFKKVDFKVSDLDVETAGKLSALLTSKNIKFNSTVKESKTLIKEAIKAGEEVLNASEKVNYNLVIQ